MHARLSLKQAAVLFRYESATSKQHVLSTRAVVWEAVMDLANPLPQTKMDHNGGSESDGKRT